MVSIPDGTFKDWQENDVIKASEYKQEREMLRSALNVNNLKLSILESSTVGLQLSNVQMKKITDDEGGVKVAVSSVLGDILKELKDEGKGFHTFYAVSGSKNLPVTNRSIRGIAHITGTNPTYGYVWAVDYENNFFHNYINNDVWTGWDGPSIQKELWTGGWYMNENQTVKPSKKLSECKTGWILVWSDYDKDAAKINDYDINYTHIPKYTADKFNSKLVFCGIVNYQSPTSVTTTAKKLFFYDDKIVGHSDNDEAATGASDVVLRAVVEY